MGDGSLAGGNSQGQLGNIPRVLNTQGAGPGAVIRKVINVVDDKMLIFDPPETHSPQARAAQRFGTNTKRIREHRFVFDRLFDGDASQEEVYANTTRPLLDSVLDGYNATVFAYGATGCGKTHTISGTPMEPGIIFLTMKELFERIEELRDTKHVELSLSYLEIYNEAIRDLLDPSPSKSLVLREDANQRISVSNLSTHKPENVHEVMDMIIQGNQNRTVSPTAANATSSRSHAVLQINVVQRSRTASISEAHTFATLSIIDLAGSERASATKNRGHRLLEGANINKSLLALGNCINALCDPRRRNHVPYRDSKLTRLLKFSLGGNCKTVMIVCVSPSSRHYDETLNTLKYADRAKKIKTKVIRNEHNLNRHVGSYLKMITEQKQEIEELRAREAQAISTALATSDRARAKCNDAIAESLDSFMQSIASVRQQRESRVRSISKMRSLAIQISQVEVILRSFGASATLIGSGSEAFELGEALRQSLNKLTSERSEIENFLYNNSSSTSLNNSSDQSQLDNVMHSLLRRLEDTRGWTQEHSDSFRTQADYMRLQAELESLNEVFSAETDAIHSNDPVVEATEILAGAFFKILSDLGSLSETSAQSGEDIKSFELARISDKFVDVCRRQFTAMSNGINIGSAAPGSSFAIGRTSSPHVGSMDSPFTSSSAQKRPASSTSLSWDSPSSSPAKPPRKQSGGLARRPSDFGLPKMGSVQANTPPSSLPTSQGSKRLSLPVNSKQSGSPAPISLTGTSLRSKRESTGTPPPQSLSVVTTVPPGSTIHQRKSSLSSLPIQAPIPTSEIPPLSPTNSSQNFGMNGGVRALRRQIAASGTVLPSSMKKHSVIVRSPVRRKSVKRVRWEDNDECDEEEEEEEEEEASGEDARFQPSIQQKPSKESLGTPARASPIATSSRTTPSRIGIAVSPRPTAWVSTSLPGPGTPSNLPRFKQSPGGSFLDSAQPPRRSNSISIHASARSRQSLTGNNGTGIPQGTASSNPSHSQYGSSPYLNRMNVVLPMKKSMMGEFLFNNDSEHGDHDDEMNEGEISLDQLGGGKRLSHHISHESDMSIDSIPSPPVIHSIPSYIDRKISLDNMDIDSFEVSMESAMAKPPTTAAELSTTSILPSSVTATAGPTKQPPKIVFGVKGDLRRKSSITLPAPSSTTASTSPPSRPVASPSSTLGTNGPIMRPPGGPVIPTPVIRPNGLNSNNSSPVFNTPSAKSRQAAFASPAAAAGGPGVGSPRFNNSNSPLVNGKENKLLHPGLVKPLSN